MPAQRRRAPSLRTPFVLTVAAVTGAIAAGCGGRMVDDGGGGDRTGTGTDTGTGTRTDEGGISRNPPACPTSEPALHSACANPGAHCTYEDHCPSKPPGWGSQYLECTGGQWEIVGPPYPALCPSVVPQEGSSCAACAGHYPDPCAYDDCLGTPSVVARCDPQSGTWSVMWSSCNPPAPTPDAGWGSD
jgi:hypothetical protein